MKLIKQFNGACGDGEEYFKSQKSMEKAWLNCKRSDWMMWALDRIDYRDDKNFRLFAAKCACDTPLPDGRYTYELLTDKRSRDVIEAAILFAYGKITEEDLASAWASARDAAGDAAGASAWASAWASARASAGYAARASAGDAARDAQSDFLREFIKWEDIAKHLKKIL